MSILKKALADEWIANVATIEAAEMDSLGRLLQQLALPGLLSPTLNANFAAPISSNLTPWTILVFDAFAAGDLLFTAGAMCASYYRNSVDFLTAGVGGGALPTGNYKIYFDVYDPAISPAPSPTPVPYQCYPIATTGSVDETTYLQLATVYWNGTTLSSMADTRTNQWGVFKTDYLACGMIDQGNIGSPDPAGEAGNLRRLAVNVPLVFGVGSGPWSNSQGYYAGNIVTYLGVYYLCWTPIAAPGPNPSPNTDPTHWVPYNFNLIGLTMFSGSMLRLYGSQMMVDPLAQITFDNGDFTTTPAKNQVTGASMVKAWAHVNASGTILGGSFNVAAVSHTISGSGVYLLTLSRGFSAAANQGLIVTTQGLSGQTIATGAFTDITPPICNMTVTITNLAGALTDDGFTIIVVGGNQAN